MGKRQVILIIDDLTGKDIPEGTEISEVKLTLQIDGEAPETWDLTFVKTSKAEFDKDMAKYTSNSAPVNPERARPATKQRTANPEISVIRHWWKNLTTGQRIDMGDLPAPPPNERGRIPETVQTVWDNLPDESRAEIQQRFKAEQDNKTE